MTLFNLKNALWLFLFLLCSVYSAWSVLDNKPKITLSEDKLATAADAFVKELTVVQFDKLGKLTHYLHSKSMTHTPLQDEHLLITPHIIVSEGDNPPWEIHAKEATAINHGQEVTFNNDVIIHQKSTQNTEGSILKTNSMTYYPKDKLAISLAQVIFTQAGNEVRSLGMKAFLAENRVQLLSNARGIYVPNQG